MMSLGKDRQARYGAETMTQAIALIKKPETNIRVKVRALCNHCLDHISLR
jgi:hypothetical protein